MNPVDIFIQWNKFQFDICKMVPIFHASIRLLCKFGCFINYSLLEYEFLIGILLPSKNYINCRHNKCPCFFKKNCAGVYQVLEVLHRLSLFNDYFLWRSGPRFNIKTTSYQYRKSHCGDKTILRPSYLHSGISCTGKMVSLYWIRALLFPYSLTTLLHIT